MTSAVSTLTNKPKWLAEDRVIYEIISGSRLYQTHDVNSDLDVVGVCIPPIDFLIKPKFIHGFSQSDNFDQFRILNYEIDLTIYNVAKFAGLASKCNPNLMELLFAQTTPEVTTNWWKRIWNIRHEFLSKIIFTSFIGYAKSQMYKIENKSHAQSSKRLEYHAKFGYDVKYAYHCVRLLKYGIDLADKGDIDVEKHAPLLKDIKHGKRSLSEVKEIFNSLHNDIVVMENKSSLPESANIEKIEHTLYELIIDFNDMKDIPIIDRYKL